MNLMLRAQTIQVAPEFWLILFGMLATSKVPGLQLIKRKRCVCVRPLSLHRHHCLSLRNTDLNSNLKRKSRGIDDNSVDLGVTKPIYDALPR